MDSPPPVWKLEVFDREGCLTGLITKNADGPPVIHGSADDLAHAAAEVRAIPRFFTNPESLGRAAYNAWREMTIRQQQERGADIIDAPHTWEALKELAASASSAHCETLAGWIAIGKAAIAVEPCHN